MNEGNDVLTPADFKDTILSHGGVSGVTVALVDTVIDETVAMQGKWKGISTLNSFSYTNNGKVSLCGELITLEKRKPFSGLRYQVRTSMKLS